MIEIYENYWKEIAGDQLSDFNLKWPELKRYIPKAGGEVILDFGCGNGKIIKEMMVINPKAKFIGIDVSQTALNVAAQQTPKAEFYKINDGDKFPFKDESIDFVFASEVIEHVYNSEKVFKEISRVLKWEGKTLLTTPYHGFIKNIVISVYDFNRHFNPNGPHIRFYTKKSLFANLERVGIKPIKYGYFGRFYPVPHCIFVIGAKLKEGRG